MISPAASGTVSAQLNAKLGDSAEFLRGRRRADADRLTGSPRRRRVDAASITKTLSSLTSGSPQLQLFTDNGAAYSGAITARGLQMTGLAGRISVNNALIADPSKLVHYSATTLAGDTTRPDFITKQLTDDEISIFGADRHRQRRHALQRARC